MKPTDAPGSSRMLVKFALIMVYLTALSYGLFFADGLGRTTEHVQAYNLTPFHEIMRYVSNVETLGLPLVLFNILGNVVVFLPFGFLVPSMWAEDEKHHPLWIIGLTLLFSATVEVLQFLTNVGAADVDDVILNTLGGFLGYMFYALWRRLRYGTMNREV